MVELAIAFLAYLAAIAAAAMGIRGVACAIAPSAERVNPLASDLQDELTPAVDAVALYQSIGPDVGAGSRGIDPVGALADPAVVITGPSLRISDLDRGVHAGILPDLELEILTAAAPGLGSGDATAATSPIGGDLR